MKPFYFTSEFWTAVIPAAFGILVTTGVVAPDKASELQRNILAIVGALLTIVPSVAYANNRTALKQSIVDAVASDVPVDPTKMSVQSTGVTMLDRIKSAGI